MTAPTIGYVTDGHPAARERDTADPAYMAGVEADAVRLADDLAALRARYPDGGTDE